MKHLPAAFLVATFLGIVYLSAARIADQAIIRPILAGAVGAFAAWAQRSS